MATSGIQSDFRCHRSAGAAAGAMAARGGFAAVVGLLGLFRGSLLACSLGTRRTRMHAGKRCVFALALGLRHLSRRLRFGHGNRGAEHRRGDARRRGHKHREHDQKPEADEFHGMRKWMLHCINLAHACLARVSPCSNPVVLELPATGRHSCHPSSCRPAFSSPSLQSCPSSRCIRCRNRCGAPPKSAEGASQPRPSRERGSRLCFPRAVREEGRLATKPVGAMAPRRPT